MKVAQPAMLIACFAWLIAAAGLMLMESTASAQIASPRAVHPRYYSDMPPGHIAQQQLQRGGTLRGYFQPVEIFGPPGVSFGLAVNGRFEKPVPGPVKASMMIGPVYRFKVTRIPRFAGLELYPTIEVIDRLYPPDGQTTRFPIPIVLTQQELEMALHGQVVTRVIYLEDPRNAVADTLPFGDQQHFDVGPKQDPLHVADKLGRPMAILRIGSRVPIGAEQGFAYGSPRLVKHKPSQPPKPFTPPAAPEAEQPAAKGEPVGVRMQQRAWAKGSNQPYYTPRTPKVQDGQTSASPKAPAAYPGRPSLPQRSSTARYPYTPYRGGQPYSASPLYPQAAPAGSLR